MALSINTNIASLSAQRALSTTQSDATTAMQRLATGLRINSAKDDAAGLAVVNKFTSQITGMQQASRNASDAVALLQTAESGLNSITENLQRIRELAVQAASDTLSDTERGYLNNEVTQLRSEIDRVATVTKYGDIALLAGGSAAGTTKDLTFQVGANNVGANDRLDVSISDFNAAQLGNSTASTENNDFVATVSGTAVTGVAAATTGITLTYGGNAAANIGVTAASLDSGENLAGDYAAAISAVTGVTATASNTSIAFTGGTYTQNSRTDAALTIRITHGGTNNDVLIAAAGDGDHNQTAVENDIITAVSGISGLSTTGTAGSGITIVAADGKDLKIAQLFNQGTTGGSNATYTGATVDTVSLTQNQTDGTASTFSASNHGSLTITGASGTSTGAQVVIAGAEVADAGLSAATTAATGGSTVTAMMISGADVSTQANAQNAIYAVDQALSTVNSGRASLGGYQARFESVVSTLDVAAENALSSRARILDADFAQESAQLAKTQVLQQAGISVLAQANAMPQQVLALLQ